MRWSSNAATVGLVHSVIGLVVYCIVWTMMKVTMVVMMDYGANWVAL